MKKFFESKPMNLDAGLLLLRVVFGGIMAGMHGWGKFVSYADKSDKFLSFMGMSPAVSLSLTIFAEFFCSILLVLGLFTRIASIPSIIAMLVAVFVAHADDPFKDAEHAFLYLIAYIIILLVGPGKYSLDAWISRKFEN